MDTLLKLFDFNEEEIALPIREKCILLLKAFRIEIGNALTNIPEITGDQIIDQFLFRLIGFTRLPIKEYQDIFDTVRKDLQALLELIDDYEEDHYVKSYLAGELRPDHEMKIRVDFYERCRKERDRIVKYITYEIYEVALYNAWLPHPEPVPEMLTRDDLQFRNLTVPSLRKLSNVISLT